MNKNVLYLLITIAAIVLVMMFTSRNDQDAQITTTPEASPTNGMVGSTTDEPADTTTAPEALEAAPDTAPAAPEATAPASGDVDGVPSGAEVSGDPNAPASSTPQPSGTEVPPSEGQ